MSSYGGRFSESSKKKGEKYVFSVWNTRGAETMRIASRIRCLFSEQKRLLTTNERPDIHVHHASPVAASMQKERTKAYGK